MTPTRRGGGLTARAGGFLALAVPMVVSRAGIAGMGIADAIMVGRHGAADLALLGLSEGTIGRLLDVFAALLLAGMVLAARANAQSPADALQAGATWRRAVTMALLGGLVCAAVAAAAPWWLGWLGEPPALVAGAAPVVAVLGAGIPLALVALVSAVFLEAIGRPVTVAIAVVLANVLNLGGNWLLIGGGFGLPALGALGSAISTSFVRLLLAAALVTGVWMLSDHDRLGIRRRTAGFWHRDGAEQRRLGIGAATTAAVLNSLGMSLTVLASWLGALPLAAMTALWSALSVGALLGLGFADATALRVAASVGGAGQAPSPRAPIQAGGTPSQAIRLGLAITMIVLALLVLPVILAPTAIADLYAGGEQAGTLRTALVVLLPLGAAVLLLDGGAFVCGAALRGLSEAAWPAGVQIAVAVILLPLAWWFAIIRGGGAIGLVEAILIGSLLRTTALAVRLRRLLRAGGPAALAPVGAHAALERP
jgi:MATE family multidrug resistance protein